MTRVPSIEEVRQRYGVSNVVAKRATFMMDLSSRGRTAEDAARLTQLTPRTVRRYIRRFQIRL